MAIMICFVFLSVFFISIVNATPPLRAFSLPPPFDQTNRRLKEDLDDAVALARLRAANVSVGTGGASSLPLKLAQVPPHERQRFLRQQFHHVMGLKAAPIRTTNSNKVIVKQQQQQQKQQQSNKWPALPFARGLKRTTTTTQQTTTTTTTFPTLFAGLSKLFAITTTTQRPEKSTKTKNDREFRRKTSKNGGNGDRNSKLAASASELSTKAKQFLALISADGEEEEKEEEPDVAITTPATQIDDDSSEIDDDYDQKMMTKTPTSVDNWLVPYYNN